MSAGCSRCVLVCLSLIGVVLGASIARAQATPSRGVARSTPFVFSAIDKVGVARLRLPLAGNHQGITRTFGVRPEKELNAKKYVLVGAVIGAAVLGGLAANRSAHCDDCFLEGPFIYAATATGAVGGGLIGWVVYRARK